MDLSALIGFFPDTGDVKAWFWMPADNLAEAERRDHAPYRFWAKQGLIEATPGRAIDKKFIAHRIGEVARDYDVQFCAADRWRLDEIERLLQDAGVRITMKEHGQGWRDMGPSCDAIETAVLRRELKHPGHPVLDWCVSNGVVVSDPTGARKIVKDKAVGRVDGLIALTMAVGSAAKQKPPEESVYKTRGLTSVRLR
jgi:phage terminase large subunit-like protein